ncbi:glycosyl transferase [Yeosuana aromativorans]|uniref:Glycosyl transferase n=1 Tax=Yeosuana aromativorans TaxID=288019 RepID=A0A8J3FJV5_9FLAO|nr:glycosyltransferase family 2 protein [Yeosuana aromativorans]GGK30689.1 glycosyl transferase [Yeosuana aromativorans]
MKEKVSIITPVYNSETHILDCIVSVINQSYTNWEHIIIDDFSSDNSVSLVQKIKDTDERIKLIRLDKNSGAGFARNIGIKKAKGRYIAFLDADDYWHKEKLEKQIYFMLENKYSLSFTAYYEFDNNDGKINTLVNCPEKVNYNMLLMNGGFMGCLTVMYDTKFFGKRYMPEIRKRQDWALWLKMLKEGSYAYGINEPLAYYRKGNTSLSKSKIKLVKHNFMVYRKELKMSFIKSVYRMFLFLFYHFFFKQQWKESIKT